MANEEVFVEVREAAELEQLAVALQPDLPDCGCVYNIVLMKARLGVHVQSIYVLRRQSAFPVVLFREKVRRRDRAVHVRHACGTKLTQDASLASPEKQKTNLFFRRCETGVLCQLGAAGVAHMHSTWKFGKLFPLSVLQALYPAAPSCAVYPHPTSAAPTPPTSLAEDGPSPPVQMTKSPPLGSECLALACSVS
ncbi:uncharacterized protein LOC119595546 [Penaeus monodon]|uniref:uncharacterized protein LOC119595546 n=1 Tax=Penaeus monodon TaxID=6687 RepID=UPI0018A74AFA|nr:uncharacterized protein LOC119595546 [Penaeus monodon]